MDKFELLNLIKEIETLIEECAKYVIVTVLIIWPITYSNTSIVKVQRFHCKRIYGNAAKRSPLCWLRSLSFSVLHS